VAVKNDSVSREDAFNHRAAFWLHFTVTFRIFYDGIKNVKKWVRPELDGKKQKIWAFALGCQRVVVW